MIYIILAVIAAAAVAAAVWMWFKWRQEFAWKISCGAELEHSKKLLWQFSESILWYADALTESMEQSKRLQDKLSAIKCPRNDHVWQDGVCTKCGREKNG